MLYGRWSIRTAGSAYHWNVATTKLLHVKRHNSNASSRFQSFLMLHVFPKKTEKLLELTKIDIADCLILATLFWATSNILFSSIRCLLYIINREFDLTSIMSHGFRSSNLRIVVCNKRHQRYVTNVATHLESNICIIARIARICINFTEESKIKITVKGTSYLGCRWTLP